VEVIYLATKKKELNSKPTNKYMSGNGYSGTDIVAVFRLPDALNFENKSYEKSFKVEPKVFAELKTVSYSTFRDKFPVRAVGHIKAKGYTTGSRTVAGTLIFKMFDKNMINKFIENLQSIGSKKFNILPDELPPFDIDITMMNEMGMSTRITIVGVDITEGNQILSIDQLGTEEKFSFVAQDIITIDPDYEGYQVGTINKTESKKQDSKKKQEDSKKKESIDDGAKNVNTKDKKELDSKEDDKQTKELEVGQVEADKLSSIAKQVETIYTVIINEHEELDIYEEGSEDYESSKQSMNKNISKLEDIAKARIQELNRTIPRRDDATKLEQEKAIMEKRLQDVDKLKE
jgi:hypothetical protein